MSVFGPWIREVDVESLYSSVWKTIEDLFSSASYDKHIAQATIVDLLEGFFAAPPLDLDADEQVFSLLLAIFHQKVTVAATYLDLDSSIWSFSLKEAFNVIGHKQLRLAQSYLNP